MNDNSLDWTVYTDEAVLTFCLAFPKAFYKDYITYTNKRRNQRRINDITYCQPDVRLQSSNNVPSDIEINLKGTNKNVQIQNITIGSILDMFVKKCYFGPMVLVLYQALIVISFMNQDHWFSELDTRASIFLLFSSSDDPEFNMGRVYRANDDIFYVWQGTWGLF